MLSLRYGGYCALYMLRNVPLKNAHFSYCISWDCSPLFSFACVTFQIMNTLSPVTRITKQRICTCNYPCNIQFWSRPLLWPCWPFHVKKLTLSFLLWLRLSKMSLGPQKLTVVTSLYVSTRKSVSYCTSVGVNVEESRVEDDKMQSGRTVGNFRGTFLSPSFWWL